MSEYDDYLDRILDADASRRSVYFERGTYLVQIGDLMFAKNRRGEMNSIWEVEVLRSNNSDLPPGTQVGWLQKMHKDSSPGNIKLNLAGTLGCFPDQLVGAAGKKAISRAYSDEKDGKSPLAGVLAQVTVAQRTSAEGYTYLFVTFTRSSDQDPSAIPSQEAWLKEFGTATTTVRPSTNPIDESSPEPRRPTNTDADLIPF